MRSKPLFVWHFYWRFWDPIFVIGGFVRFGWYVDCLMPDYRILRMTRDQYVIKREMGLFQAIWRESADRDSSV